MIKRFLHFSLMLLMAVFASGCVESREDEVLSWMAREKSQAVPRVAPLQAPTVFVPADYDAAQVEDPFSVAKLARIFAQEKVKGDNSLIAMHINRRKEVLEAYPLDSIKMVGFMEKEGRPTALLEVEQHLYQVNVGSYLGQNYGKIEDISESQLQLHEVVQDATGEWSERSTLLELQE
ncbi:pilus assembly protein PilP [Lampropedia puyangensis]|uniref:Pilus assembly protein PilP n=1 Tax=Lampropedia puyangensis TaxID=1330072 RepID=A0A4S8F1Y4_9BURK|nr:pilus assembly protein PilP [Lampropedia puyangensis]THU00681.1 pilus assembly protein PilP [Lampropedia puyangensis]